MGSGNSKKCDCESTDKSTDKLYTATMDAITIKTKNGDILFHKDKLYEIKIPGINGDITKDYSQYFGTFVTFKDGILYFKDGTYYKYFHGQQDKPINKNEFQFKQEEIEKYHVIQRTYGGKNKTKRFRKKSYKKRVTKK
jgi:hypothetical protein